MSYKSGHNTDFICARAYVYGQISAMEKVVQGRKGCHFH